MKNVVLGLLAALSISACAKAPGAVQPVSIGNAYQHMSCTAAIHELSLERQNMAMLEGRQRAAATGDAVGVFLVLLPLSSVFGADVSGDLSASKGKVLALESKLTACRYAKGY